MKDFRNLKVWEKAHALALSVYRASRGFPADERFGVTSQIRRAAVSIPTNIAEGCGRDSDAELNRFLQIAMGSASEVEYLLFLCLDLAYLAKDQHDSLHSQVTEIKRMLAPFIQKAES